MSEYKILNIEGAILEKEQLEKHLKKIAASHILCSKSEKETYPIPRMIENFQAIKEVHELLNQHLKLNISIHPAGEWLLDNFYIIEEAVKMIEKELTLKKYINLEGLQNGQYQGFARVYVLATEIISHTDNKCNKYDLENYIQAYQSNKTLSMDEIWSIGIFLQIAIIEKIRQICEIIYISQIQKAKAENIVERLIEKKSNINKLNIKIKNDGGNLKYPFVEHMSHILKRYGKKTYSYLEALEEIVNRTGTTISEVIKKEHFDIAIRKISIGNGITSIKAIQRINFLEIFEKINGVEEILKKDPARVYEKMDYQTKEYYRGQIKEISKKTKISELYIARKVLEISSIQKNYKRSHVGYYLVDKGLEELYKKLQIRKKTHIEFKTKVKLYLGSILIISLILSIMLGIWVKQYTQSVMAMLIGIILFIIPISEVVTQIIQFISGKIVKPKLIPKIDFFNGVDKENTTIVVIPTIIKSAEKVKELMRKLEVFYLANKSTNIYFALLGDCTQSKKQYEIFDREIVQEGNKIAQELNKKYYNQEFPIFHFFYRNRNWNGKENAYMGWERKRGLLNDFNEYILENEKNKFKSNTIEEWKNQNNKKLPKIKYVITLDSDTNLSLNSAFELIGAMAHVLNKPIIDKEKNIVVEGHALIQPRIGIDLGVSNKNLFTKIFAGAGGIDSYTNAISDIYQDNFNEGIYTGKGIYDLEIFSKILKDEIPENTVLSHDLLEGCYLRCGLASDIMLMDGYPAKYASFMSRLSRWIRGDWQIYKWIFKRKLNLLSKYKIFDNLRRSLFEAMSFFSLLYFEIVEEIYKVDFKKFFILISLIIIFPFLLEIFNNIASRKNGEKKQKTYTAKIDGISGFIIRAIITFGCIPYKAYVSEIAKWKTIYRMFISKKHLLEWTTSEEAERISKTDLFFYYKLMNINFIIGTVFIILGITKYKIFEIIVGIIWLIIPTVMWYISKEKEKKKPKEILNKTEKQYINEIGQKTWDYFETYLNKENNYLIPDNFQEDRKPEVIGRTSSTNIGLSILAVISGYDLNYIEKETAIEKIINIINTVEELPKWNGHLYNWYDIKNKIPLMPRYISTVDSGNFVGYLMVLKSFLQNCKNDVTSETDMFLKIEECYNKVDKIIENTKFEFLYDKEKRLFSVGFNIEDNKLTDSYYDLLASEARQTSIVAIAKKDVPVKHWNNLSRTLTELNQYKGLISWSGTFFEYFMPNINIPRYEGSLLDESCKLCLNSQIEYSKNLGIPWGISEAAFNVKDLHSNYQYKAFGIPWLGLKRGLADEMVVASYGSILAIVDKPKEVVKNLKELEKQGMYSKFGFYESIDFTPQRVAKGKIGSPVKTYMAHHQALILLSINNLFNDNILQKRFMQNPEIEAVSILLQERMPKTAIITKETKEKVEKIKYTDYEDYISTIYTKIDERLIRGNVISSQDYTIAINQKGVGISKYKNIYINRYKKTDDYMQGMFFYIKNIRTNKIWSTNYNNFTNKPDKYTVKYMPDQVEYERQDANIKTKMNVTIATNDAVEIRRLELENLGTDEEILEVTSYFEPVLSPKEQEYAHQAFNNLFLIFEYDENTNALILRRKSRNKNEQDVYLTTKLCTKSETIGDYEYEIDKEKFIGRCNFKIPKMIENSLPFSKKIGLVTEPIVAQKITIKIKPKEKVYIDLILSIDYEKEQAVKNLEKYDSIENVKRAFELSKATVETENRYLGIKGQDNVIYQKMLSYIIFENPIKRIYIEKLPRRSYTQEELWKYGISGDLPIILLKIKDANDIYVVKEVLKAYEFFRSKNIEIELVIIDEEKYSYENFVKEEIESEILNNHIAYLKNIRGGIFVILANEIERQDMELLSFVSSIIIDGHLGGLENRLNDLEEEYFEKCSNIKDEKNIAEISDKNYKDYEYDLNQSELIFNNEYGGFSKEENEYCTKINNNTLLPTVWSNILANKKFGTITTENMGGYTWYKNSRLNRLSCWNNSATMDIPSEVIYIQDMDSKKTWSIGYNPMPDDENYYIIHGFGYSKYIHSCQGIIQELTIFVPENEPTKIYLLKLKNSTPNKKNLKIVYYIKPIMDEDEIKSNYYIDLNYDYKSNSIYARNLYSRDFEENIMSVSCSEKIKSYTGNKKFFLGRGGLTNPDGLRKIMLDNDNSLGKSPCIAIEIEIALESFSEKEVSFILCAGEELIDIKNTVYKYSKISNCKLELSNIKNYWNSMLERIKVSTPIKSINIMLNGWTMYQTISSRLNAKSGFYQSGGAYGFRDQLQDTLGVAFLNPEIMKNQIIKHSEHQFIEGDVEHWWHEETKRGIRTKFSDDLLWLVFITLEYVKFTGDTSIWDIKTNYLKGDKLEDKKDEKYDYFDISNINGSIYEHCKKAINKSLNFGENGLPKIGSGDWNDGFNKVGNKGKGESVWLGFFIYYILDKFIPICIEKNETELAQKYEIIKSELKRSLNSNGWDGRWYKRAYTDNGECLGSMENDECRIDGISQSWATISGAGDNDKKYISMQSLENHLIDKEVGIIKLLDPPFDKNNVEPGYIKAYMPGVRENGGQYTHVCFC